MAPSTPDEIRSLNILLHDVLYDVPDDGPDLPNVKTRQEWSEVKTIFWKMIKLRPFFIFPPMEMVRGGTQTAPIGENHQENIINYSLALGGFFRSSLIFATKIRLNQRIIENAGNPQTGEGGWYYRNVPPSFNEIIQGPASEDNRVLLIGTIKELSKTWDRFLFKKFYMIVSSSGIRGKAPGGLELFLRSLINYDVLSFEQMNNEFRNFYSEYVRRNEYPPGRRPTGILLNRDLRTVRPTNLVEIEQNQLWIEFIDSTFSREQMISIVEKLIDIIDFTRSETAADSLIEYIVNIIIINKNTFRIAILEELIFVSMERYLVNAPRRPDGKSVTTIFTLAMMEIEQYIMRNLAAFGRIAAQTRRNYLRSLGMQYGRPVYSGYSLR